MAERVIGGVLFAIFLVLAGAAWRQKRIGACLPWFMLASASMLTAAMTTVGRSNVPSQPSRYIPFAVLFTIAVLFLSRNKSITIAIAASLITLNIVGALACTPNWISQQHFFAMNKSLVQLVDVVDETKLLPDSIIVNLDDVNKTIARINALDKHGYILPPVLHTNTILLISDGNVHPECGLSHFGKTQDGQLAMAGIGQLEGRCADMILLTQNGQIFSVAYVNPATKEWAKIFTPTELHEQPQAWAFDAEKQVAYLLPLQP
jgi:hypothetical protein